MSWKVGFATAGEARGSLVFVKSWTDSYEVIVLPRGAEEAGLDHDFVGPEYFEPWAVSWQVKWFDEAKAERIWTAVKAETDRTTSADREVDALAKLTWNRLQHPGFWLLAPNAGSLVRAIELTSGQKSEPYSRRKLRDLRRLRWILDPLLFQLSRRGLVLAVMKRDQIPTNLWDE